MWDGAGHIPFAGLLPPNEIPNGLIADYWTKVVEANQDVRSGDTDLLFVGETIRLPEVPEELIPELMLIEGSGE